MGVFAERDLQKANASSGGNYFEHPGNYECQIAGWKNFNTKARESALIVDLLILKADNDAYATGSIRNYFLGEADIMFDQKVKNLLVAAMGLNVGLDADKIEAENWYQVLESSIKPPLIFLKRKVNVHATHEFKAEGRKKLKKSPGLEKDPDFVKEYQFTKVEFSAHDDTRKDALEKAKAKK